MLKDEDVNELKNRSAVSNGTCQPAEYHVMMIDQHIELDIDHKHIVLDDKKLVGHQV